MYIYTYIESPKVLNKQKPNSKRNINVLFLIYIYIYNTYTIYIYIYLIGTNVKIPM